MYSTFTVICLIQQIILEQQKYVSQLLTKPEIYGIVYVLIIPTQVVLLTTFVRKTTLSTSLFCQVTLVTLESFLTPK